MFQRIRGWKSQGLIFFAVIEVPKTWHRIVTKILIDARDVEIGSIGLRKSSRFDLRSYENRTVTEWFFSWLRGRGDILRHQMGARVIFHNRCRYEVKWAVRFYIYRHKLETRIFSVAKNKIISKRVWIRIFETETWWSWTVKACKIFDILRMLWKKKLWIGIFSSLLAFYHNFFPRESRKAP